MTSYSIEYNSCTFYDSAPVSSLCSDHEEDAALELWLQLTIAKHELVEKKKKAAFIRSLDYR